MRRSTWTVLALAAVMVSVATRGGAQPAGFVVTLGADTVQVERVTRTGTRVEGTVVLRTPTTLRVSYAATLDAAGRLATYEQWFANGDGTPLTPDPGRSIMTAIGDSLVRESGPPDRRAVARAAAPGGAFPLNTIPVGTAFGIWEAAIGRLRGRQISDSLTVNRVQPVSGRLFVSQTAVLHSGPDSVEMDYFGQGRAGFRFDREGRLTRSDWRRTTYQIIVVRVPNIDIDVFGRAWSAQDKRGDSFGRLSMRDTVRATVGNANLWLDYSRPSKRGRQIWGKLVPWDTVWRLGADQATQFRTDIDLTIGGRSVPAGTYTLWMRPSRETPELIVSNLVGVFGTQYDPRKDFVRVPLSRAPLTNTLERLKISIGDDALSVEWDDARYSVPIRVRQ